MPCNPSVSVVYVSQRAENVLLGQPMPYPRKRRRALVPISVNETCIYPSISNMCKDGGQQLSRFSATLPNCHMNLLAFE